MATGTLVDVVMPQMGVSVSEGTITRWAKNAGETVEADETIVEISTDKVDTEVPAPATGVVRELLAAEGETVPVNTRIAVIDTGGGTGADRACRRGQTPMLPPRRRRQPSRAAAEPAAPAGAACAGERERASEARAARFVSPVVARMVAEHNLDINAISGTGAAAVSRRRTSRRSSTPAARPRRPPRPHRSRRCTTCPTSRRRPSPRHPRRRPLLRPPPRLRRRRRHPRSSRASPAPARSSTGSTPSARSSRATCATRSRRPRR